ncbi:MAG: hypothetical protein Q4F69_05430 [Bacteroidia bacterium]|nr:hypothetical protein [Bacteroidia bacterium]
MRRFKVKKSVVENMSTVTESNSKSKHKSLAVIGASYLQRPLVEKA